MTDANLSPLRPLELALQAVLQLDPASREAMAALEGRVLEIRATDPVLTVFLLPGRQPRLVQHCTQKPETVLEGSAPDLLALLLARDRAQALINSPVRLKGNSQLLLDVQALLGQLDPDWEKPLAAVFGDVAGHQLGRGLRQGLALGRRLADNLSRSLGDYLHEEARLTPSRAEVEAFIHTVQQVRQDTDRLAARLARLRQRAAR